MENNGRVVNLNNPADKDQSEVDQVVGASGEVKVILGYRDLNLVREKRASDDNNN